MSEADIKEERIRKLQLLREAGMEPYPIGTDRSASLQAFLAEFDAHEKNADSCALAGRIMAKRGQGGIMFVDIFDGTARVQAVFQRDDMEESNFSLFAAAADISDFIQVKGVAYTTKRGEKSLKVSSWQMLAKSLLPIPDEWFGLKDEELRLRERYLDMLLDADLRAMFERRARFWQVIRNYYIEQGFLEVETPVLESSPGGADARPFETHHNALDIDVSLRISLELWLKRLLIAGYPKVFEIGRIFRNEGQSREHLQDYVQWESYEAYKDMRDGMKFIQELYRRIAKEVYGRVEFSINGHSVNFASDWPEMDFCKTLEERFTIDPLSCTEEEAIQAVHDAHIQVGEKLNKARAIDHLWKSIRKGVAGPVFLVNVPVYLEPLAKRSATNEMTVERFQIVFAGSEMGKGFSELNDPMDQRARFEEQQKLRDEGDPEAQRLDEDFVRAMEYGMPPAFGFGMSERLFSFLENRPSHEAQLFPLLRPKSAEGASKSRETKIATIVLNKAILTESWKELNTAAHLAASFAAREGKKLFLQDTVQTADGVRLTLNIRHAIMIRTADSVTELNDLLREVNAAELVSVPFTREMLETTDDRKVAKKTKELNAEDIEYLGILVFGERKSVLSVTEKFPLHD